MHIYLCPCCAFVVVECKLMLYFFVVTFPIYPFSPLLGSFICPPSCLAVRLQIQPTKRVDTDSTSTTSACWFFLVKNGCRRSIPWDHERYVPLLSTQTSLAPNRTCLRRGQGCPHMRSHVPSIRSGELSIVPTPTVSTHPFLPNPTLLPHLYHSRLTADTGALLTALAPRSKSGSPAKSAEETGKAGATVKVVDVSSADSAAPAAEDEQKQDTTGESTSTPRATVHYPSPTTFTPLRPLSPLLERISVFQSYHLPRRGPDYDVVPTTFLLHRHDSHADLFHLAFTRYPSSPTRSYTHSPRIQRVRLAHFSTLPPIVYPFAPDRSRLER